MSKGEQTRERIVSEAWRLASRDGLGGLSLGRLAEALKLSKSGLFAHFGSKEELELEVLRAAEVQYQTDVVAPALKAPRGAPRIRAWFKNWREWIADARQPGGCIFVAASAELDDVEGPLRELVARMQRDLLAGLSRAARIAVEEHQFRADLDCEQFAFEILAIALGYHHAKRLLRDPGADARAERALDRLIAEASRI